MQPMGPYANTRLLANCTARAVTLQLPTAQVEDLLPYGMVLGSQTMTPRGTHPVTMWFYDMYQMHMNIPAPLPNMTYNEHVVGIPYVYTTSDFINPVPSGPFFYMPILLLNNLFAILGGRLFWGFEKYRAHIDTTDDFFLVRDERSGEPLVSLQYEPVGPEGHATDFPLFGPMYELLQQPMITMLPMGLGPVFVCSDFARLWHAARVRPLRSVLKISRAYLPALPTGRFPKEGTSASISSSTLGAFSLRMQYSISMAYPIWFHPVAKAPLGPWFAS